MRCIGERAAFFLRVLHPRIVSAPRRGIPTLCLTKLAVARRADAFLLIDVILTGCAESLVSRVYVTIALFTVKLINVAVLSQVTLYDLSYSVTRSIRSLNSPPRETSSLLTRFRI